MKRLSDLYENTDTMEINDGSFTVEGYRCRAAEKSSVNIIAMGDVGSTLALAMKLTGGDAVSRIGICDINENTMKRYETELNQITMPFDFNGFPQVETVGNGELYDCDALIFCASRNVPPADGSAGDIDVRMIQLKSNLALTAVYAEQAASEGFEGDFFVVSDPVDPLCKGALLNGVDYNRIQGFGLGVMNARAAYYAMKQPDVYRYVSEGRAFGPHGEDLVIADSIDKYDDERSAELTALTVNSNRRTRELGFKPYIAPAVSSGALSILENLRGNWHYSSAYFGTGRSGAFLGMKNRRTEAGLEIENLELDDRLFDRIRTAYENLKKIV